MNMTLAPMTRAPDLVPAILRYMDSGNDIVRSVALRALAAQAPTDPRLHAALTAALLDPDPDVRTDAMELFAGIAGPEDTDTILRSLEGDPVREVKLAAIRALTRHGDEDALVLLRALALSRCDEHVAWEDTLGDWEDWLDIQLAVIAALGSLGDEDAVEVMRAALFDEMGQNLDVPVFAALRQFGGVGVAELLSFLDDPSPLRRQRALGALTKANPAALQAHVDALLAASEPALRRSAVTALSPEDPRCARLATEDDDTTVRRAALRHAAAAHPGLAIAALSDPKEAVQAAALQMLSEADTASLAGDLASNLQVWVANGGAELAGAAAEVLARIAPETAAPALLDLAQTAERPLDARVAAVRALAALELSPDLSDLRALLANPTQQIRAAVLAVVRDRAAAGDEAAIGLLAEAIAGELLDPETTDTAPVQSDTTDVAAPKGEGAGRRQIRITPDGDIVDLTDPTELASATSTLAAIQMADTPAPEPPMAEDTPEESGAKRRARRPVEGPDAYAADLSRVAITVARGLAEPAIIAALGNQLSAQDAAIRCAAWSALLATATDFGQFADPARAALDDPEANVRHAALQCLERSGTVDEALVATALADSDGLIRAWAVAQAAPAAAAQHIADANSAVRAAAANRLATYADQTHFADALDNAIAADKAEAIEALLRAPGDGLARLGEFLENPDLTERKALLVLTALASARHSVKETGDATA